MVAEIIPPSLARSSRRQPNLSPSRETPATTESFGGRRRRSCIHDKWREGTLSLVSFDVKGPYNGGIGPSFCGGWKIEESRRS
ncbi:hypothetical protein N7466_002980 [Penicillium verhagenii]|uniref:uncharacterized protein n=1 Tax=Penicillium verhagenii TaxID=1562060 RepID=UPI0025459805|nr:uncharacterized protein N7466_002980 [Penicillium verhagenii]KAJ5936530.1 hypothetical protein N7466_002980 [Penicillium verhagenii]